jgi:hypothetical protein
MTIVVGWRGRTPTPFASAQAVKGAPAPIVANQAEAEVVSFLATLQEKGRFVDFLMGDITIYSDAQVGEAARVAVPVQINPVVTELGTLELWMKHTNSDRRWKVEFAVRTE